MREGMVSHHSAVSVAEQPFQAFLSFECGSVEARKKIIRFVNGPTDIHHQEQAVVVGREHLLEFAFVIVHSIVELMNPLDRPGPFPISARLENVPGGAAEGGHHSYFGFAHLEYKQ